MALRLGITGVWLVMGLGCKILDLVPRHRKIVGRILGEKHARPLTVAIGAGEVGMAAWVASGYRPRSCAAAQIGAVLSMNVLELCLAPGLLLFRSMNGLVALAFSAVVFVTGFILPGRSR